MTRLTLSWSTTLRAWRIRYAATDTGSGVASYKIRLVQNGQLVTLAMQRTTTGYTIRLPRSAHFRVLVSARDRAGNLSPARSVSR